MVSNFKSSHNISQSKFSILLISLIIHFTSSASLFTKFSVDNAQSVKYSIHKDLASLVILTAFSAPALCHAIVGRKRLFAHLLFQSIIIQRCFIVILYLLVLIV
jgi:hypothetical protein